MTKKRLDILIQELYPNLTRSQIQSFIMQGLVEANDKIINKPGTSVNEDSKINLKIEEPKYVSRAGFKLEKALDHFKVDPSGMIILDAGISTGGFTDCLLQRGAKKIYGIDVGYGLVHEKIRTNSCLTLMEKTNLRYLENLPDKIDLVTLDLSFISILKVIDVIYLLLKENGQLITLIKPQFEAGRGEVPKGGVIKDQTQVSKIVDEVIAKITEHSFEFLGVTDSPILGTSGNKEILAYFRKK